MRKTWLIYIILAFLPQFAGATLDLSNANNYLHEIEQNIQRGDFTIHSIEFYQKRISQLQEKASQCIATESNRLSEIDALIQQMEVNGLKSDKQNIEYIQQSKKVAMQGVFDCRLFLLHASDVNQSLQQVKKSHNNKPLAVMPIWETLQGIFLTLGAVLIFIAIVFLGNIVLDRAKFAKLSFMHKQRYPEFVLFKFSLYALLAACTIFWLLEWWGVPLDIIARAKQIFFEGTSIYGVEFIPMRLILGVLTFALIEIAWKFSLVYVSNRKKIDPESDSRVVLTSLLSYVVFALAILIGLGVSGVDFTGIAIVAGALSVGIGFGLQNIVNNFVSGIILLLEKTIKPGDRISISGYEGFVRKINLRFTRLATLNQDDVLIPNSDLITSPIINYEFEDKMSKVRCYVGVAYGSDLELVKRTLLNVALEHPETLSDPNIKPMVYLTEFGDNNLLFELQCIVGDVNRRAAVTSEIYFKIIEKFKEYNIKISYPRRDVKMLQEE